MDSAGLLIDFDFTITALFGSGYFPIRGGSIGSLGCMLDAGMPEFFSVGFGGIMGAFGRWVIEEEGRFWSIPSIGFIVFIKFDF